MDWMNGVITIVVTISDILTAGIAILAFSILLYSLNFNLRDRVARAFALIMICLVIVFSTESFSTTGNTPTAIDTWLRVQWVGIIMLPAAYLNFSDALLATTGLPSRWRRKWAIRVAYFVSFILVILLGTPWFLGTIILDQPPAPHHQATIQTGLFTIYYAVIMVLSWVNFIRAYKRTITPTSKRRMFYLILSGLAPAFGSFPFLLYASTFAAKQTFLFWLLAIFANLIVGGFISIMAYSVAFFGVQWPDRVVKSRLLKWGLRGPITASLTLAVVTIVRRGGEVFGNPYSALVPIVMVVTIVLFEFLITLFYPHLEKWLFYYKDEDDFQILRSFEEKTITRSDLRQLLEMILAAVCDRMQVKGAYLLALETEGYEVIESTGAKKFSVEELSDFENIVEQKTENEPFFSWNSDAIIPLVVDSGRVEQVKPLGFLGIVNQGASFSKNLEEMAALKTLTDRAAIILRDRATQEQIFQMMDNLNPQNELIQQLRVAGRYNRSGILDLQSSLEKNELRHAVKDALTHYWGGPRLTDNPLMSLRIIQESIYEGEQNATNALRSVLKSAIDHIRPGGDRRYTGEWLLYNILDMKFLEGKKVREIALKLALSEADLYRKQRVAIDLITDEIVKMELKAQGKNGGS